MCKLLHILYLSEIILSELYGTYMTFRRDIELSDSVVDAQVVWSRFQMHPKAQLLYEGRKKWERKKEHTISASNLATVDQCYYSYAVACYAKAYL